MKDFMVPSSLIKIKFALLEFDISLLFSIYTWMASRQFANSVTLELKFLEPNSKYILVSSAYR